MGTALVEDDVGKLHAAVGFLRSEVQNLLDKFEDHRRETSEKIDALQRETVKEHREVYNIVAATSEAMRNVDREVQAMKPLTEEYRLKAAALDQARKLAEDYREERAEKRGEEKFKKWLYGLAASVGGLIALILGKLFDRLTGGTPPMPPHP